MIEELLEERLPGVEVWAYGSRVSGRSHDASDLDLVLRSPGLQPIPARELAAFTEALRRLQHPLPGGCPRLGTPARHVST